MISVGVGVYPVVAALNHSCEPNCTVTYIDKNEILVLSTGDIKAREELTICYVEESMNLRERQAELLARYGFQCDCLRCKAECGPPRKKTKVMSPEELGLFTCQPCV